MPLFFSHTFPALAIDIVEIDAIVIKAASQIMGFPLDRCVPGLRFIAGLHTAQAEMLPCTATLQLMEWVRRVMYHAPLTGLLSRHTHLT